MQSRSLSGLSPICVSDDGVVVGVVTLVPLLGFSSHESSWDRNGRPERDHRCSVRSGCRGEQTGDPPAPLQRGFPGLFLPVSIPFLGLPCFSCTRSLYACGLSPFHTAANMFCLWATFTFTLPFISANRLFINTLPLILILLSSIIHQFFLSFVHFLPCALSSRPHLSSLSPPHLVLPSLHGLHFTSMKHLADSRIPMSPGGRCPPVFCVLSPAFSH